MENNPPVHPMRGRRAHPYVCACGFFSATFFCGLVITRGCVCFSVPENMEMSTSRVLVRTIPGSCLSAAYTPGQIESWCRVRFARPRFRGMARVEVLWGAIVMLGSELAFCVYSIGGSHCYGCEGFVGRTARRVSDPSERIERTSQKVKR